LDDNQDDYSKPIMKRKTNIESVTIEKNEMIFCAVCDADISVDHIDDGTVIINCPRCIGECLACDCHLAEECFPDTNLIKVIHAKES
jgi:hypothetical protein